MADNDLLKEFQAVAAEFTRERTNFQKDGPSRQTGEYKKRKTVKAISLYEKVIELIAEIEQSTTVADPCFELEKKNLEINFNKYMDMLKAIPDEQKNEQQQGGQQSDLGPDTMRMFLQNQDVRFENIRKVVDDIENLIRQDATLTRAYCKLKLKSLQDAWGRIQTSDEESAVERSKLPDSYFKKMDEFERQIEQMCLQLEITLEEGNRQSLPKNDDVKLPRVTIPKFHGDYFKWVSFRDLFCAMVKDKVHLSNGQKMQMLKTLVDGEAAAIIADLTIADVNFNSAWDRLLDRYDNNRVVVYKHLHRLISQTAAKNDSKTLKKLLDTTDQVLLALQNMGRPIDKWDDWIIITVTQKLNEEARKDWERKIGDSTDLPKWEQLKKFLGEQFRMLEGIENNNKRENTKAQETAPKNVIKSYQSSINMEKCPACQGDHRLFTCSVFKEMDVKKRWEMAKKQKLCFACLSHHEDKLRCDKQKPCKKCNRKHSTWLHEKRKEESKESETTEVNNAHGQVDGTQSPGLLATILVLVQNERGQQFFLRALADSGSQASMITSKAAELLDMDMMKSTARVEVLGGNNTGKAELVHLEIQPRFTSTFTLNLGCYVLKKLTEPLPNSNIEVDSWDHIKGLTLADPMFNKVGSIDLLLGADAIGEILLPELRKGPQGTPMAQKTKLGWIIFGRYDSQYERKAISCNLATIHKTDDDDINLSRFWEIEDLNPPRKLTKDEETCEEMFRSTYSINQDGTFVVKIPFKQDGKGPSQLGDSRKQCMARLMYLEKRFNKDEALKKEYTNVMQEYIDMEQLEIMRNNLPMDSVVPEVTHYDIKSLYKIITGSARVTHNYIVLDVHFPLVSRDEFQLWHVIPIPTQHENQQITIIPDTEFLMINLQRNNFYTLDQQDVRTCLKPRERMLLCHLKQPMYTTKSTVSVCERNLLNHQLDLDPTCKLALTSKKEFWIGLTKKNHWIYGTIQPETLNIVCGNTAQQLVVNGSGILEVMPGCEVNQPGITLIAESIKQTTGDFNYYPLVNLSDAVTRAGSKGDSGRIKMINLTLDHSAQLDSLSSQLHELDQQTNAHRSYHVWHSGGHTFSILAISIMIILIWFNRTKILEFIATWITRHESDDVELSKVDQADQASPQHGRSDVHHSSDDIQRDINTVNSHEGGRCPFQT